MSRNDPMRLKKWLTELDEPFVHLIRRSERSRSGVRAMAVPIDRLNSGWLDRGKKGTAAIVAVPSPVGDEIVDCQWLDRPTVRVPIDVLAELQHACKRGS